MSELLRESLEAVSAEMVDSTSTAETVSPSADTSTGTNSTESGPIDSTSQASSTERTDGRDASGKFVSKSTAGEAAGQAAPTGNPPTPQGVASSTPQPKPAETTQTEPPKPGEPDTTHAPPSWKIGARSVWDKVPPEARREIARRELETSQAISRTAPARQFVEEIQKSLAPLLPALQAQGIPPQRLIADYARFDLALRSGDPAQQAVNLARLIKAHNVPIEALADAIDGKLGPQQRQPSAEEIRAQIKEEMRQEWQQHQQRADYQNHSTKVAEFAKKVDPTLFNDDVRHDMAALIEAAAARGVELSLQDAYDRATRANPEAWAIVQQREQAKAAATNQQATQRAQAASGSLKSRPASPVGGEARNSSIMDDLKAAAALASGRT
jgi:hypothetical protein